MGSARVLLSILALLPGTILAQSLPERYTIIAADYGNESLSLDSNDPGSTGAANSSDPSLCTVLPATCQPTANDNPDNNIPDWTSTNYSAAWYGTERRTLYGQWHRLQRFDVNDDQFVVGGYAPMSHRLGLSVEGSHSPEHRLVPQNSLSADLGLSLNDKLIAHIGGNQSHFSEEDANALQAGLELHRPTWRLSYTLTHGWLQSGESGNSHTAECDRYYGQNSQIGLVLSTGAQPTRIDPDTVVVTDVRSATLSGRHWLGRAWGVSYAYGWTDQSDFYTRQGGSLGLLIRF